MPTATPKSFVPDTPASTFPIGTPKSFVPDAPAAPAPQGLGADLAKRQGAIFDAAKRGLTGKQPLQSAVFDAAGQGFGAIGDVGGKVSDAVLGLTGLDKPLEAVAGKVAQIPGFHQATDAAKAFYASLSPENKAHVDAIAGFASGAGTIDGANALKTPLKAIGKATLKPVAEATGKSVEKAASSIASLTTNVPKDVFQRAADPAHASMIEKAITSIDNHPLEPFREVAQRTATQITAAEAGATRALSTAKNEFTAANPRARFDVRPAAPKIIKALEPFRSSGLTVDPMTYRVVPTPQSPFTKNEIEHLNGLLGKLRESTSINADDVLALRQSFNTAYDEIPLGENGKPRPYHAAIMAMKSAAEPAIDELLPEPLKQALQKYSLVEDMKSDFGNRVISPDGTMKPNAEQFLANLGNMNKGELRATIDAYKNLLGIDITAEVQAIKDAKKLSDVIAPTGGRTQDVFRSMIISGIGGVAAGPFGMAAGAVASSPKLVGKAFLKVGKNRAEALQKSQSKIIQSAGASTKRPIATQTATAIKKVIPETVPQGSKDPVKEFLKGMPPSKDGPSAFRPDKGQRGMLNMGALLPKFQPKALVSSLSQASNALKMGSATIKPGAIERAMRELKAGTSHPIRVRRLPSGGFVIEDGRHRLEAARRLGIKKLPIEDVTHLY